MTQQYSMYSSDNVKLMKGRQVRNPSPEPATEPHGKPTMSSIPPTNTRGHRAKSVPTSAGPAQNRHRTDEHNM
ncbi:hypothetical protein DPEC_G00251590 [Dallia pectoralis]|uniref:Uncharacterized protein n=1 Tax=Dallia pectoralis TaxID=75939 RepID=A0ACC2FTF6_DALPE|nr:hypothetical protein DPEC_G00251590 [Dallia pectoralis]